MISYPSASHHDVFRFYPPQLITMLFSWGGEQLLFRLVPPFFVPIMAQPGLTADRPVSFFRPLAHSCFCC